MDKQIVRIVNKRLDFILFFFLFIFEFLFFYFILNLNKKYDVILCVIVTQVMKAWHMSQSSHYHTKHITQRRI